MSPLAVRGRPAAIALIATVALGAFAPGRVGAATFVVDDEADAVDVLPGDGECATAGGVCSLRAAVMETNAFPGVDEILVPAGTYPLDLVEIFEGGQLDEAGDLDLLDDVMIIGAGAIVTTVEVGLAREALPGERIFEVHPGVDATLESLTIRGGRFIYSQSVYPGAGIANAGTLRILGCTVRDNRVDPADAGGIANRVGATLVIRQSSIIENGADDCGGLDNRGTALLENVTLSGNSAYYGGAICSWTGSGPPQLMILSSTITGNRSNGGGGPVAGTAIVGSTILAGNDGFCWDPDDCGNDCGLTQSLGKNLVSTGCGTVAWLSSDLHGTTPSPIDPMLAPLAYNGSATPTHALLPGSPAIDHVVVGGDCPATDQRGILRPQDGDADGIARCDIGAFEADRQCANGIDDDGDGLADFPADPGCASATGTTEVGQCQNGRDDDGDGRVDHDGGAAYNGGIAFAPIDPQCAGKPFRKREAASCGLGAELVVALSFWRTRRRRAAGR